MKIYCQKNKTSCTNVKTLKTTINKGNSLFHKSFFTTGILPPKELNQSKQGNVNKTCPP
jgi:hypothetical protein